MKSYQLIAGLFLEFTIVTPIALSLITETSLLGFLFVGPTLLTTHLSPRWGLGELVYRCSIHISPRWGFVGGASPRESVRAETRRDRGCPTDGYKGQFYRAAHY